MLLIKRVACRYEADDVFEIKGCISLDFDCNFSQRFDPPHPSPLVGGLETCL